jgi:thiamine biosynthesis lipoprotein
VRRVEHLMGTAVSLDIADPLPAAALDRLAGQVFDWLRGVDHRFSTYRDDSEVSRLGQGRLAVNDASPDLRRVLDRCARLWRFTDGYFDAYATGALDPSGYVKGWSVQVASDRLVAAGAGNHCLNAGGDVRVRGRDADGEPWRIGVQHPTEADKLAWVLAGEDLAVATSGTYQRGPHVVDPHRGEPARGLCSVTVVGPDLGDADAYATAAVAMGRPGLDWLARLDGYESAAVTDDGRAFRSPGLPVLRPADPAAPGR